jgi:hypothetical protein
MKQQKTDLLEAAVRKVAGFKNTEIVEKEDWTWNIFTRRFRYFDRFNTEYKADFVRGGDVIVSLLPVKIKKAGWREEPQEFIVSGERVYRKTDRSIVLTFISLFLSKRNYGVERIKTRRPKIVGYKWNRATISDGDHTGEIEITKTHPFFEVKLKDSNQNISYFCAPGYQYIFRLKPLIEWKEKGWNFDDFIMEYEESEIATTTLSPLSIFRRALYGFKSSNLRAFYSEEGIFPEVKHAVRLSALSTLATAIINASVFVRVAEKLKGNTWYTLAAGALVFIRAPVEILYMKRSLKMTEHLPAALFREVMESESFKRIYERREIKIWRNFERILYDIIKQKDDFSYLIEKYGGIKSKINALIEEKRYADVMGLLEQELYLSDSELKNIEYFIFNLPPICSSESTIINDIIKGIENLEEKRVLKTGSVHILKKYVAEMFRENLLNNLHNKAFKLLNDRMKHEERSPEKEEVTSLVADCKKNLIPFRIYDILLFLSLYVMGYTVTFVKNIPELSIPLYYIFYGMSANIIIAAVTRFGSQVGMQYLYRNLDNAPTIRSAADAWNEYNSHIMRIWAVFSSLGLIIGLAGRMLSDNTYGISRYVVEGFALILYIQAFREWYSYYDKLEKKSKESSI